jgi:hypothetical protein
MASPNEMQANRFEYKYIISERCARTLRDFARPHLVPDEHADPNYNYSYAIHSVYLDGPGLPLYYGTVRGVKNRYKMRIRYYDDRPENPVFFEIKRRVTDVILKSRAMIKRIAVPRLLQGYWPEPSDLVKPGDQKSMDVLNRFWDLHNQIHARGRCIVSYLREAWVHPESNSVRMTFDRNLVAARFEGELRVGDFLGGVRPHIPGVVLELKFTDRFPHWMSDMVRVFGLQRGSMAKYVTCIDAIHPREQNLNMGILEGAV